MSGPLPGQVRIEGLYEGPSSSWEPQQDLLADALRRAGAPEQALHALVDGGRASLEPSDLAFPRGQFSAAPGDALALALELLLEETAGGRPDEWFSTLRVVEYRDDSRVETLIKIDEEGVRTASREAPWVATLPPTLQERLRTQWPALLAILIVGGIALWMQRDELRGLLGKAQQLTDEELQVADAPELDPAGFAGLFELTLQSDQEEVRVVLTRGPQYPQDAAAIEALRAEQGISLDRLAALRAVESGKLRVVLRFAEGGDGHRTVDLLDGEIDETFVLGRSQYRGRILTGVRLRPD